MEKGLLANARVGKILEMSRDFQIHKNNIVGIQNRKTDVINRKKRTERITKLLDQKSRNFFNAQGLKLRRIQLDNFKIVERLAEIHQRDPRKLSKSNSNQTLGSLKLKRSHSAKSINSTFRKHQSKRIVRQNTQLGSRIINSKPQKIFLLNNLKKDYKNGQKYVKSISRYSQKNRRIRTSIVEHGLLLKKKQVSFLPNLQRPKSLTGRSTRF